MAACYDPLADGCCELRRMPDGLDCHRFLRALAPAVDAIKGSLLRVKASAAGGREGGGLDAARADHPLLARCYHWYLPTAHCASAFVRCGHCCGTLCSTMSAVLSDWLHSRARPEGFAGDKVEQGFFQRHFRSCVLCERCQAHLLSCNPHLPLSHDSTVSAHDYSSASGWRGGSLGGRWRDDLP